MKKRKISILCFILSFLLIAALIPGVAAADDTDERWADAVYVLGTRITSENCDDVLGNGKVRYDHETRTLFLNNATLDLADYHTDADENNTVYGIDTFRDLKIVLSGENKILSAAEQFSEDKEYIYGISASGELNISGAGTLDIAVRTSQNGRIESYYGIDSTLKLTIDGVNVQIHMSGDGRNKGIAAGFRGFFLKDQASVKVIAEGANSTAVYDSSFGGSVIEEGSTIEMQSDSKALEYITLEASAKERGALVNTAPTAEGAQKWDKTTRLTAYKYVRLPDPDGGGESRGWKDNIYILGARITDDNCDDVLNDGGTVQYDHDSHTLMLRNAQLNLANYIPPTPDNNYVAGINAYGEFKILLEGENRIFCESADHAAGMEYVFAITASEILTVEGDGSLDIELNTENSLIDFRGIDSMQSLIINGPLINIEMTGSGRSTGADLNWDGFTLKNGAELHAITDSEKGVAVYDRSYGKSSMETGTVLEMISEGSAFRYIKLGNSFNDLGAFVNPEATSENASEWDKTTRLDSYRYVKVPAVKNASSDQEIADEVIRLLKTITEESTPAEAETVVIAYYNLTKKQQTIVNADKTAREKLTLAKKKAMEPQPVDISYAEVVLSKTSVVFNGKAQKPAVSSVRIGNLVLKEGTDYEVSYKNNLHAGKATVLISGKGNCRGTAKASFRITKAENRLTKVTSSKVFQAKDLKKGSKTFRIAATVKGKAEKNYKKVSVSTAAKKYITVLKTGKVTLKKGLKKGNYKLKVRIDVKATQDYKPLSAEKTIRITVK